MVRQRSATSLCLSPLRSARVLSLLAQACAEPYLSGLWATSRSAFKLR
jgi:hypothetical protein